MKSFCISENSYFPLESLQICHTSQQENKSETIQFVINIKKHSPPEYHKNTYSSQNNKSQIDPSEVQNPNSVKETFPRFNISLATKNRNSFSENSYLNICI